MTSVKELVLSMPQISKFVKSPFHCGCGFSEDDICDENCAEDCEEDCKEVAAPFSRRGCQCCKITGPAATALTAAVRQSATIRTPALEIPPRFKIPPPALIKQITAFPVKMLVLISI
jgi:hypothetical protein